MAKQAKTHVDTKVNMRNGCISLPAVGVGGMAAVGMVYNGIVTWYSI